METEKTKGKQKKWKSKKGEGKQKKTENDKEEDDHPAWMGEDLEGPGGDDPFYKGPKKKVEEKIKDVLGEEWWFDNDGDEKKTLRTKFANSDDEDDLKGDGCKEFNKEIDMKNPYFEIHM